MSALNFDPDKHRDPHEPEHHWALRRRFLEHNMGRYTEEKLVSLAQVFANMEFLGCRCVFHTLLNHSYKWMIIDIVLNSKFSVLKP